MAACTRDGPAVGGCDDELFLPDDVFFEVMTNLPVQDLASMGLVCKRLREVAHRDAIWRGHARSLLPPASFRHLCSWVALPSWKARFAVWARASSAWRSAASWPEGGERGPAAFSTAASQGGPVFCVNALRSVNRAVPPAGRAYRDDAPNDDNPTLLAAGADGVVRLLRVQARPGALLAEEAGARAAAAHDSACGAPDRAGAWAAWVGGSFRAAVREGAGAARDAAAREAAARASFQATRPVHRAPHGAHAALLHAWDAHDGGILGLSVCDSAVEEAVGATALTCAFSGEAALWRVNAREIERLPTLPVKRLKALLSARGLPWSDLREKAEFVARVRASNALPAATKIAQLEGHAGTAVSSSHDARLAATSGHDGLVKIYRLEAAFEREAERNAGGGGGSGAGAVLRPARTIEAHPAGPMNHSGADCVLLEPSLGSVASGGKDGLVRTWDLETGACTAKWDTGMNWVWCVRSPAGAEGAGLRAPPGGAWPFSADPGGGVFAHPSLLLAVSFLCKPPPAHLTNAPQ